MGHVPHLYVPGPWEADVLPLTDEKIHHLRRVLRKVEPARVSYTDGAGTVGAGTLGPKGIRRGQESQVSPPRPVLTVAVAPPDSRNRTRYLVEKLAELGVDRLVWLSTAFGQGGVPRSDKAVQWAEGALEQSRGAYSMTISGISTLTELPAPIWLVQPGGGNLPSWAGNVTLAIGPEGGFSPEEVAGADTRLSLGARVLRVETAAVVASGLVLRHLGRMNT